MTIKNCDNGIFWNWVDRSTMRGELPWAMCWHAAGALLSAPPRLTSGEVGSEARSQGAADGRDAACKLTRQPSLLPSSAAMCWQLMRHLPLALQASRLT